MNKTRKERVEDRSKEKTYYWWNENKLKLRCSKVINDWTKNRKR